MQTTLQKFSASFFKSKIFARRWRVLVAAGCVVLAGSQHARAGTTTWTGNAANGYWNSPLNWGIGGVPSDGDTVVFPSSAAQTTATNNISGLTLNQIDVPATPDLVAATDQRVEGAVRTADTAQCGPRPRADAAGSGSLRYSLRPLRRAGGRRRPRGTCRGASCERGRCERDTLRRAGGAGRHAARQCAGLWLQIHAGN